MNADITRDVVSDLWPLVRSGDASGDSRSLVDEFLAGDAEFARQLREADTAAHAMPAFRLSPDAERRLLDDARQRARTKLFMLGGALGVLGIVILAALGGALYLTIKGLGLS